MNNHYYFTFALCFIILFFSSSLYSKPFYNIHNITDSQCKDSVTVFGPVSHKLAVARQSFSTHKRFIVIDRDFYDTASPALIKFVWFHECGHHTLGHLEAIRKHGVVLDKIQFEADCYAYSNIKHEYDDIEFNIILFELTGKADSKRRKQLYQCNSWQNFYIKTTGYKNCWLFAK